MIRRALRTTVPFGMAAGTMYFIIIGVTATLFTVFGVEGLGWFELVLFIGVGAALGLLFGVIVGLSVGLTASRAAFSTWTPWRQRLAGGLAGGVPVLALALVEYLTGVIGILSQEFTTVVIVPTVVAAVGSAALAPHVTSSG
jgi:hypothetical protein